MYICAIDHVGTSFSDTKGLDKPTFEGMWNKRGGAPDIRAWRAAAYSPPSI